MTREQIVIQRRAVGDGEPCLIIAEVGLSHDGSLGMAHAALDAAADAGAEAVKFQTHLAEAEGTAREEFRVPVFLQDSTRQDYWRRTAFTRSQWRDLKAHADERGVLFLSSSFSLEALRLLQEVGVPAWKVPSGETNNLPLLEEMVRTGLPILLSTGMSTPAEVAAAVELIQKGGAPLVLFQCTNRYPCLPEHLGLNLIAEYRERYGVPVGFSDHSGQPATAVAAATLGVCALEIHVTFSRRAFGPDVSASLTFEELEQAVNGVRFVEQALRAPVDKEREASELAPLRALFTKSIVAACDLTAGMILTPAELAYKKPGGGLPPGEAKKVLGRRLLRALQRDEPLNWEDLGEAEA